MTVGADERRVLLCEPWFGGSHQAWAEGLVRHSRHRISLVTHPARFWTWRLQGAALTLAREIDRLSADHGRFDVALISGMVHLPALLGLARRSLAGVPVVLYLHETQLTYPLDEGREADLTYAMTNWLSMAAADRVVFNSEHHRTAWFDAVPAFLRRFPDHRHSGLVDEVRARSTVVPVGVDVDRFDRARPRPEPHRPPVVLWNHRWEHDKDPDAFVDALTEVARRGVPFELILAGQRFAVEPAALHRARRDLGPHISHDGAATPAAYPDLLARADVVVSTARHEFFGVAVVEAVAAGALPLLPHRLAYPELVPTPHPYLYRTHDELVERLAWALTRADERWEAAAAARRHVARFAWPAVAPVYDDLLVSHELGAGGSNHGPVPPAAI